METIKGQDILVDEFGMGAFSMVVVEDMPMKDAAKLEKQLESIDHVKDVLWYDDAVDISRADRNDSGRSAKSIL